MSAPPATYCRLGTDFSSLPGVLMDFVFHRTAEGRSIKKLTVVDDATYEAVAIVAERPMPKVWHKTR